MSSSKPVEQAVKAMIMSLARVETVPLHSSLARVGKELEAGGGAGPAGRLARAVENLKSSVFAVVRLYEKAFQLPLLSAKGLSVCCNHFSNPWISEPTFHVFCVIRC